MGCTVRELFERIDSREFSEWMAYAEIEPFGEERADLRSGIIAATVANANRNPKKRRRPFKPIDFVPHFEERAVVEAEDEGEKSNRLLSIVEALNAAHGGKDLRPNGKSS